MVEVQDNFMIVGEQPEDNNLTSEAKESNFGIHSGNLAAIPEGQTATAWEVQANTNPLAATLT